MLTPQIKAFIAAHAGEDPDRLALQAKRFPEVSMPFVIQQLKGRARIREKLPSWHAHPEVVFPATLSLEQCTSEIVAAYKASLFSGDSAADLTGGFGVDSFQLSQHFKRVEYIERQSELAEIAAWNFERLGAAERVRTRSGDSLDWLRGQCERFDLIYIDPARRDGRGLKVSAFEACEPDVVANWELLAAKADRVAIKASPGLDIDLALSQLSGVETVQVIAASGECKELLFTCRPGYAGEPEIRCVDLSPKREPVVFTFRIAEEKELPSVCAAPERYLYEPNPSILKAGAFKSIGAAFDLPSLHPRTRLYTSERLLMDFPGRVFEILGQHSIDEKSVRDAFPDRKANVLGCNCGLSAEELKRKLKLKDGGELYAIGAMLEGNERRLLRCARLR